MSFQRLTLESTILSFQRLTLGSCYNVEQNILEFKNMSSNYVGSI
ncbi:hypothetical protein [Wolbachia endosymbiont of Ctenocephalides felis wCfeJ]|nr:hypothetical protein [Wolbachia endosymbiont of Ctenocephalides felis wCfeJ]